VGKNHTKNIISSSFCVGESDGVNRVGVIWDVQSKVALIRFEMSLRLDMIEYDESLRLKRNRIDWLNYESKIYL
jgi:hypothetical protein